MDTAVKETEREVDGQKSWKEKWLCVYLAVNLTPSVPSGFIALLYTDSISDCTQGVRKIRSSRIN